MESIEIPSINNVEMHYIPNIHMIIKKMRRDNQSRTGIERGKRKMRKKLITLKHYKNKTLLIIPEKVEEDSVKQFDSIELLNIDEEPVINERQLSRHSKGPKEICLDQYKNFEKFMKRYNLDVISDKYEGYCIKKKYKKDKSKRKLSINKRVKDHQQS